MPPAAKHAIALGLLLLAWTGPARAQSVTPPEVRTRALATYPPEALRDRLEGTVGLEVVVDEGGHVVDARVVQPAGHGFDEAALAAVRQFVFEPARRDGVPIRSTVQLGYEFRPPPLSTPPVPALAGQAAAATPAPPPVAAQQGPDQSTLVVAERAVVPIGAPPERAASSQSSTGRDEMLLLPRYRVEGMLDVVPGLFSLPNQGGGKSQQEFVRGFNVDHGTDMAFFVDGVPINAVSHAHGQGYTDLHFLIPETVERIDSRLGPYATDVGDFGTAGAVTFRMADHVDESLARAEWAPSTGHDRFVVVESPDFGSRWRMVVAAEAFKEDGPFIHPQDYGRLNAYAKVTRVLDERSELSFMAQAYGGSWNMSGALPARAVCGEGDGTPAPAYQGFQCVSRWDSLDPTQGGDAQRVMGVAEYRRRMDAHWDVDATAYALRSNLQLFPNDGIASDAVQLEGHTYGSQIEQDDGRTQSGATLRVTDRTELAGMPLRTTMGLQVRNDDIELQLHRTRARQRLDGIDAGIPGPLFEGRIDETELGAFVEGEARPAPWLRFILGARLDRVDAAVSNESPTAVDKASGAIGAGQLSPKATAVVSPLREWDLFANYGRGFHTNDARTLVAGVGTTLVVPARGYEVGTTVRPLRGLSLSATGFLIDLDSELTIDGDTASTSPSGATRRYGIELTGRYVFDRRLYAEIAFTAAHSRYTDAADVAAGTVYVPDAPIRTFSATLGARQPVGPVTLFGSASVRSMSDRWGDSGPTPLVETGWTVVNLGAGARWRFLELGADVFNVADVAWREGQFEVASRLPGETMQPPAGISFTPGLPRTAMVHGTVYW
jgi:TonB family protein